MIDNWTDLFKPRDEKKTAEEIKQAELSLQIASDKARRCLMMEEFKDYKESFRRAEAAMMDALISYNNQFSMSENGDIGKYAMKVNRLLTKVQDLRSLLNSIETNARKGKKKKDEK